MYSRQQKITTVFEKQKNPINRAEEPEQDEELEELLEDNHRLRDKYQEMEAYIFQLQRSRLPQPRQFHPRNMAAISDEISSLGGEVVFHNKRVKLRERRDFYLRHFGIHVNCITDDLCIVTYDVTVGGVSRVYAVNFAKIPDTDNWDLKKYHLPLGFCMDAMAQFEPMTTAFMRQLQVALVAHHQRQAQIEKFKEMKPSHVHIFHSVNGASVELVFPLTAKDPRSGVGTMDLVLQLKYDPFESCPQDLKISQNVYTEISNETIAQLMEQFDQMKSQRLWDGFCAAVSHDSDHLFFCRDEEDRQDKIESDRNQRHPPRHHQQYEETSEGEEYSPATRQPQKQPPKQKEYDELSDSSTDSFNALRLQMLQKKKAAITKQTTATTKQTSAATKQTAATTKQAATKTSAKKNCFKQPKAPRQKAPETPQYSDDENDEYVTEVLKEKSLKSNGKTSKNKLVSQTAVVAAKSAPIKRSNQLSDSDVTADSYVYIPEGKTKKATTKKVGKTVPAKKSRNNESVGKENDSLVKGREKRIITKKIWD